MRPALLHQSNITTLFLAFVMECCRTVWFNSANFPKTEVGSGKSGAPVQTLENLEMKKTLVAIAALAATGAFAQVSMTGNLDFAGANIKGTMPGSNGTTFATSGVTASTSVINIFAKEDIGGGTSVTAWYGLDPRTLSNDAFSVAVPAAAKVTATGLSRDELYVGAAGSFGNIRLGSPNALGLESAGDASPLGTGVGSGYGPLAGQGMNSVVQTRYSRSARYDSPVIAGFTASVQYAPGNDEVANTGASAGLVALNVPNNRKTTEIGLKYNNGPLNASVVNIGQDSQVNKTGFYSGAYGAVAPAKTSATILGVNYKMDNTTLYFGYNTGDKLAANATNGGAVQSKGTRLAIKQTIGQVDLMAQQTTQDVTGDTTAANNVKATITGLRGVYNLSKTAATYIGYEKYDTKLATSTDAFTGGDRKIVSIGLKKSF
jgi:predicted porin